MKRIERKCVDCGRSSGLFNLCIFCRAKVPESKTAKPTDSKTVKKPVPETTTKPNIVIKKWKGITYKKVENKFYCGFGGCKYDTPNETAMKGHITREHT